MRGHRERPWVGTALLRPLAILLVASCWVGVLEEPARPSAPRQEVVVASFDFVESVFLARVYALALRHAGVPVRLEARLGPRELVQPALRQGLVDVVPEYLGTALESSAPNADVDRRDPAAVRAQLATVLRPWDLHVLMPAPAQNQNAFVVSRREADRLDLHTVSDLARLPNGVVVGGPRECPDRPYCLVGLRETYGVHVRRFVPLEGQSQKLAALEQGIVDVAVMFTTDGALADPHVVPLDDDRRLQPVENVVPVVSSRVLDRYGQPLVDALDAVSTRLSSAALRFVNWRLTFGGDRPSAEAQGWLERQDLVARRR